MYVSGLVLQAKIFMTDIRGEICVYTSSGVFSIWKYNIPWFKFYVFNKYKYLS